MSINKTTTRLRNNYDEGVPVAHGTVSTGTEDFNASQGGGHTVTTAGSHTWTLSGWSERFTHMSILLTVTGNTPTITLPGAVTIVLGDLTTLA